MLVVQIISHKEQKSNSKLSTSAVSSSFNFIYLLLSRRSTLLLRIGMCLQRLVPASGCVLHFPRISISQPTLPRTELLRNNVVPKEFCNILIPCTFRIPSQVPCRPLQVLHTLTCLLLVDQFHCSLSK